MGSGTGAKMEKWGEGTYQAHGGAEDEDEVLVANGAGGGEEEVSEG